MRLGSLIILLVVICMTLCGPAWADDPQRPADPLVGGLIKQWKEGDRPTRIKALRRLGRIGHRSRSAVPVLISGLTDSVPEIRAATAEVLGQSGVGEANPALIAALRDPELTVRTAAAAALARTRPDTQAASSALATAVRADPAGMRDSAVETLATIGEPSVPLAINLIRDANPKLNAIGVQLLTRLGPTAKAAVPILLEMFHRSERSIREHAAQALAAVGKSAIEPLTRALRDRDPKVRGGAAFALELMGEQAAPAITALIAALAAHETADDPRSHESAAADPELNSHQPRPSGYQTALAAIGPACVPALLRQLDSSDLPVRTQAVRTIGLLGEGGNAAVPRLIGLLGHADIRAEAVRALGNIGPPARRRFPNAGRLAEESRRRVASARSRRWGESPGTCSISGRPRHAPALLRRWPLHSKIKTSVSGVPPRGLCVGLVPMPTPPYRTSWSCSTTRTSIHVSRRCAIACNHPTQRTSSESPCPRSWRC